MEARLTPSTHYTDQIGSMCVDICQGPIKLHLHNYKPTPSFNFGGGVVSPAAGGINVLSFQNFLSTSKIRGSKECDFIVSDQGMVIGYTDSCTQRATTLTEFHQY